MSENPTSLLSRVGVPVAVVACALALPTAAVAHDKDKDHSKKWDKSTVCNYLEKHKKHWHAVWCPPAPAPAPAAPAADAPAAQQQADVIVNIVNQPTAPVIGDQNVAAPAAPAAPAATISASSASQSGPCEKRRVFRIVLDRGGRARSARVLLNGRAISVTRGKKQTSVLLDMRGRANRSFTVRHTVVTKKGRLKTGTRRFRTCG